MNAQTRIRLVIAVLCTVGPVLYSPARAGRPAVYPPTHVEVVTDTLHGRAVEDPYRWLEDQRSSQTRDWIAGQNQFTRSVLDTLEGRDRLRRRFDELLRVDRVDVPTVAGDRYFYGRRNADQDLFTICMRRGLDGQEQVLVDPDTMSDDHSLSVSILDVSPDGQLLAYGVRSGGEDQVIVRVLDVENRRDLPDVLARGSYYGGVAFTSDLSGLYYGRSESVGPRVYYHEMGTDPAEDSVVFGDGYGPDKIVEVAPSHDRSYLLMTVFHGSAATRTEVYFKNLAQDGPVRPLVTDIEARFRPVAVGRHCYLLSNWEAPNGRILRVDLEHGEQANWREVVPAGEGVIEDFSLVGGKLCLNYVEQISSHLRLFDTAGTFLTDIALPETGSSGALRGTWDGPDLLFRFSSFVRPRTIYRYNLASGDRDVWFSRGGGPESGRYDVKQVWYSSVDGTRLPMFVVHRSGLALDGSNPVLMTGYGGFNHSMTPWFSPTGLVWAEHGGVYVVTNLRGGGEFGETWHRAGMFESKQNTFDDFTAAAEWLMHNGYTSADRLAISGGSNGGLLVGAALTQRPELFKAVLCTYPLLDMIRYHMFLVARFWTSEYGSSENADQFSYLMAYSPYHNVRAGTDYPAVLFVTGDADTRVDPCHARKMTALLQSATAASDPVLLLYDTQAGHSEGRPVGRTVENLVDEVSFLFWQLQVRP
ncbi:MAG TPA: prolyl oligopeptidase family serine peptidase [Acidobacteriota bacterium]|nr:prolyl oligopeptidase family serine peptidase [Acidobacteriota bacterium]